MSYKKGIPREHLTLFPEKIDDYEELLEDIEGKIKANPELMRKRSSKVEHVFAIVKRSFGYDYELLRGLDCVNTESSKPFLTYNIKRVMNIF